MKEGCREDYRQGAAAEAGRTKQSCGVTGSVEETGSAKHGETGPWHPQNSWPQPRRRTVTESIIYFRTLDLSLRFLGR